MNLEFSNAPKGWFNFGIGKFSSSNFYVNRLLSGLEFIMRKSDMASHAQNIGILFLFLFLFGEILKASDLKASIGQMPIISESHDKGFLPDLVKAMAAISGQKIYFEVVPFARSMEAVREGKVDFHIPLIEPFDMSKAQFSLSKTVIFKVNFVLYYNKNHPLDLSKLAGKNIESDKAHTSYFPFEVSPSSCIECSLKKVDIGRIDGFIFADTPCDPIVKSIPLRNIRRKLYRRFDVKFVLKKGAEGGTIDKFLTKTMSQLEKNGELKRIVGPFSQEYSDWQPSD